MSDRLEQIKARSKPQLVISLNQPDIYWLIAEVERLQNGDPQQMGTAYWLYERAAAFEEAAKVAENAIFMSYSPHDHPERIAAAIRKHAEETA